MPSPPGEYGPFDAVVGRRVLMYQSDAVASLTRLADALVPGGLIVLQEHDSTAMPVCLPELPLHRRVSSWMWETVAREGADPRMGLHLAPMLVKAGFKVERVRAEFTVPTPEQSQSLVVYMYYLPALASSPAWGNACEDTGSHPSQSRLVGKG